MTNIWDVPCIDKFHEGEDEPWEGDVPFNDDEEAWEEEDDEETMLNKYGFHIVED